MKKIGFAALCAIASISVATPVMAKDITLRYNQIDSSYEYEDSDTKNDVSFSGPTIRLTGDIPSYNLNGVYAEVGYLSESDTPFNADMINLGAGLTRNLYRNNNLYIDGSIGLGASKYDADGMDDSLYYVGIPAKAQIGLQQKAFRAFVEVGYRHDWVVDQDKKDLIESAQPSTMGGVELGVGVRYNFDYGWWTPKPRSR